MVYIMSISSNVTPVLARFLYIHPVQVSKAVSVLGIHHLQMHFCIGRPLSRLILNIRMESAALTDRKNPKWPANGWKKNNEISTLWNFVNFFF